MNRARIVFNVVLAVAATAGGIALLTRDRWTWMIDDSALVFTDTALLLLALSLLLLAGFTASITLAWARGDVEMPSPDEAVPHPAYRGRLLARYWYLIGPSLACFLGALWLAM